MNKAYSIIVTLLIALTLLSLTLNVVIIFGLLRGRRMALNTVSDARGFVKDIGGETISYTFEIDREIDIKASIPFSEEIAIPINTTFPISTTIPVPIDLGVTTYDVEVPINTVFPVDIEVPVPVSKTVDINTAVPLDVAVPIEIPIADTPLAGYLEEMDASLAKMENRLRRPLSGD